MKVIEQTYTVDLTIEEAEIIQRALHAEYMSNRKTTEEEYNDDTPGRVKIATAARTLRNMFSDITGRYYMGQDA